MPSTTAEFFDRLSFPDIWRSGALYPESLRQEHEALLAKETPGHVCGTEHYRYGAFCYYVKSAETSREILELLIQAASQDPDDVMAQAALIDIASHPNCSAETYALVRSAFHGFPKQYFEEDQLRLAYEEGLPSWSQ